MLYKQHKRKPIHTCNSWVNNTAFVTSAETAKALTVAATAGRRVAASTVPTRSLELTVACVESSPAGN